MKKFLLFLTLGIVLYSCIPIRIAPNIKDYKITNGKRFKRGLPKKTVFVFEDPKDANEFYNYINIKFELEDYYVDTEVPFMVENKPYYFSFYEVEIPTKTINLIPLAIDGILSEAADMGPLMEDVHASRFGNWHIAIEVFSDTEKDCLSEDSISKDIVLPYLRNLKQEYLSTHNYNEVVFKN
ncbi:hypothetical protein FVB32_04985 [Flagellimonas hymeniacidonis]|uniref:Lipoprotein n=1 Tax=Flagellimonas hymeniacidonis TaxID=2603628 RepID=A0A5C8V8E7_9FLAO|nr:hypothetical protein [Flagellimonas hymeniacidonis]TXN37646.1 hypothetical protein FVB32_04985 [Flagellimonas hymeniacidonis]